MNKPKQIRIISDGTPNNTQILNHDGVEIPGVTKVEIIISTNQLATAYLTITNVSMSIAAQPVARMESGQPIDDLDVFMVTNRLLNSAGGNNGH